MSKPREFRRVTYIKYETDVGKQGALIREGGK